MARFSKLFIAGFLVALLGIILCFLPWTHEIEESFGLGVLFNVRGPRPAPTQVAVVSIDKESADRLKVSGNPSRWPRQLHGQLVEQLTREGARAIVFDIYFVEPRALAAEDEAFAAALRKTRNVVLGEAVRARDLPAKSPDDSHRLVKVIKPIDILAQAAVATTPFVLPRLPVRISRYWTFQKELGHVPTFPAIALPLFALDAHFEFQRLLKTVAPEIAPELATPATQINGVNRLMQHVRDLRAFFNAHPGLGDRLRAQFARSSPIGKESVNGKALRALIGLYAGDDERFLNFYGAPRTIYTVPFYQALQPVAHNAARFAGRVVFVGLSETVLTEREDSFHTVFSQKRGVFVSGVEIAATAFGNLANDDHIEPLGSGAHLFLVFAWGALIGTVCFACGPVKAGLAVVVSSALYFGCANYLFARSSVWLPLVVPLVVQAPLGYLGAMLWNFFEINSERQKLRKALGFYVPEEVVHQLARDIVDLRHGDQTVSGVCLMTDITGYTSVSESMTPRELSELMRRYLEAAFEPIQRHGGVVIDLTGDSILAIWRGPALTDAMRRQACEAAIELARAIHRFNQTASSPALPTRIGAHAGAIFLGNVGAGSNYRYGARGDTVNTAARLDSLNRLLGTEILLSEELVAGIDGFLARPAGRFILKGKSHALVVSELFGRLSEATPEQKQTCNLFADGLEAFKRRSWDEAEQRFSQVVNGSDRIGLAQFYLQWCREYRLNPPAETWDGTILLDEK